jgi:D-3-phosphoglycerate dehydrogenase / 2-oxoglutarate reductase
LLQSLRNGRLKGAALDVIADEYFSTTSNPLMEYARTNKNLVITPHIGGNTYESFEKTEAFIADKITALLC